MQDFRVKSGLVLNGNIFGANYVTTGNITVTYTGLFKNVNVSQTLVADEIFANTVAVTGAISTESGLTSNDYITFKDGSQIGDETGFSQLRIRAPLNYGVTIEPDADISGNSLAFVFNTDGTFVSPGSVIADLIGNVTGTVSSIDNHNTDNLKEGSSNLYFTAERAIEALQGNNVIVNNLTIAGDLEIQGNTVTVNAATLTIEDKNIIIANGAVTALQADGAGITIEGANATITYLESGDKFEINKNLDVTGKIDVASTDESFNGGTTGALTVAGGAFIAGNLIVGDSAFVGGEPVITLNPLNQSIALLRSQLEAAPGNVLYVAGNGNDANDGTSLSNAYANIHTALERAQPWTTVFVKSGDYVLYNQPVTMRSRVGLVGDNLRTTTIRPANAFADMFYVNNACYATGITFRDHQSPAAVFSYNPDGSAGFITTSPYIQNCSSITTTGTGMRVDGRYVTGLRSMVCDSYTQTNAGGIGIHMLNRGYTQLVSVFTICCDIAILCENGGFCSITNSNSSFGNYGLVSRGVSEPLNRGVLDHIEDDGFDVYYHLKNLDRRPNYGDAILFANYNQDKCARDTGLIVDSLAFDLAYQSNTQSAFAGLQYWSQSTSAIPNQATETIAAFNYAKDLATNVAQNITITSPKQANIGQSFGVAGGWSERISDGFDLVANIITSGTFGITDRIIPNRFPANTNVDVNNAANLVYINKEFIQKEVIAFVNQEYPGFWDNANNFIDPANAITKCERDTGYLIESIIFDFLHGGNRQAVTSGVYYYNNDFNDTQIENQIVQTSAAYDFIGSIIDEIVKNEVISSSYQDSITQNTLAATAATIAEANAVINNITLITDIIENGSSAAPAKRPISYTTLSNDSNVISATQIILANRDYIVAEVTGYINQNWANISNGTVAFYSVANSSPLVANTAIIRLLETINDITFLPNISVTFHQPSYISGSSHTFEYVGTGVDLLQALPYNGGVPIQENEVTEIGGGLVYFTSTDQQGDFRIGNNLLFNRVDGTITGETFNKSLFAVMTPYILAIEG
jgi:hypothetical protein